jgi:hypothetical protein
VKERLTVEVVRCENLYNRDSFSLTGGKSDPYVRVKLEGPLVTDKKAPPLLPPPCPVTSRV